MTAVPSPAPPRVSACALCGLVAAVKHTDINLLAFLRPTDWQRLAGGSGSWSGALLRHATDVTLKGMRVEEHASGWPAVWLRWPRRANITNCTVRTGSEVPTPLLVASGLSCGTLTWWPYTVAATVLYGHRPRIMLGRAVRPCPDSLSGRFWAEGPGPNAGPSVAPAHG